MERPGEGEAAGVPLGAKQAADVRARWAWAERTVWTDRMLTALEEGVKGGKWFSLMDKVSSQRVLRSGFDKVKANRGAAGVDRQTVQMFEKRLSENLEKVEKQLRDGIYVPQPVRRVWIDKPGSREKRPLGIPTVRDRVVQSALRAALEPIFERDFAEHSYGFRPNRCCKDALRRVDGLLKRGYSWVVDADLKSYFDTIPREKLMARIREKVADGKVLKLLEDYLRQQVMDGLESWVPEGGTPQGAIISPLLSNLYLDPLDHLMQTAGFEMTRYADDFVIQCRSEADARAALEKVREWTAQAGLTLHPEKTRLVDATQRGGFDFLGYHFERGMKWPRKKSAKKFRDAIRQKTKRANGRSLERIIADINRVAKGWYEYFKHSHRTTFAEFDGWIRMRLRSILRKRRGGKGRGRGADHQRWPNAYFAERGLFSMQTARAKAGQPARR
jgi:RNA-directed DNA polymerase